MTSTSRNTHRKSHTSSIYATSDPSDEREEGEWGQPSISHYDLSTHGEPIKGMYVPSSPEHRINLDPELAAEFEAWEAASDEDFIKFEEELD